ncbi:TCR/Tet family MFS transporter [Arcticibacter tournemirensis]|uniref:MFS transporter n=1 Tax=Arcticibacter tournemirensis TaxID=699437 RepID=A0A4Q0ME09_9SPHI|nr:TCR/Tet family MFS transporter [Arcticibacter tournemirensis]RXF71671.1 MFS transporter [Arcticibacter tournemirensis]
MRNKKQAALSFIFITLLVDVIGMGIIIPVLPKLITEMIHSDLSVASEYGGWMMFAYSFMQFIFAPVLGNLSDRFGRRPVLLLSLLGFGLDYLFLAYAPSITWLFVGRVVAGITGASFTAASAYIADISTPEKRAQNFGLIGAAFGIGFIIGPVLGGVLGQFGSRIPFLVAAALSLLNFLYGFFILPESLSRENRRPFELKRANPVGSLKQLRRFPAIAGLIISLILVYIAAHSVQSTWTYYVMEKFKWNEAWVGYSLGFVGLLTAIVQAGLIRIILPRIGQEKAIYVGLLLYSLALLLFSVANKDWMMFAFMIPYTLGGIAGPAIQGIISTQVPSNEQGELQGGLTSLMSATSIIGPPLMTTTFAYFTGDKAPFQFPGAPFLLGAVLMLISALLSIRHFKKRKTAQS